jgi:hypothetical protein
LVKENVSFFSFITKNMPFVFIVILVFQ